MVLEGLAQQAVSALGIKGVSTVALVLLVSIALYAHKASTAGRRVAGAGSTMAHDAKVVAIVLTALLVLGVATLDIDRGRELIQVGIENLRRSGLVDRLVEMVR